MKGNWVLKDGYAFCECGDKTPHTMEPTEKGWGVTCQACGSSVSYKVEIAKEAVNG